MIYTDVFRFFISHTDSRIHSHSSVQIRNFRISCRGCCWKTCHCKTFRGQVVEVFILFHHFHHDFCLQKCYEIQAYQHTFIYIYSTYPQDSPKIYLSRVVDSQVSQFWSPSGSFSFRSGLHGGDDAQRFSWPNPVLPIHNGQARLNATPFRLWIFAAVWRSFNRLKILQLEGSCIESLFYLKVLDSLGCFYMNAIMSPYKVISVVKITHMNPYDTRNAHSEFKGWQKD